MKDKRIIATGYNGAPSGKPHCLDMGCLTNSEGRHCQRVIHAEINALKQVFNFVRQELGHPYIQAHVIAKSITNGATLYEYDSRQRNRPCPDCQEAITKAGINKVILNSIYSEQ